MAENSFPTAQEKWDKIPSVDKKWTKWNNQFINAQAVIERAMQSRGGSFGSTNAEFIFHVTGTSVPGNEMAISSSTANKLDGYLDNLATAATNKRDVLNRLVANNERF